MISVAEALKLIVRHRPEELVVTKDIFSAKNHTLAKAVRAKVSQPPQAVSAMDGYAVRLADVRAHSATLQVIGEAAAGAPYSGAVGAGEAVRIFTGSIIPDGADHIVIQEDADRSGNSITCKLAYASSAHIRYAGMDFAEGDTLLGVGEALSPYGQSICAAGNHASVSVFQPLDVAILTSGDELKPPGSELGIGEIINSNSFGLGSLIIDWGGRPIDLGITPDNLSAIRKKISGTSEEGQIIVAVGGASVGDYDFMRQAFLDEGFRMIFEKVAVRPGKPTWFAKRGHQVALGLPGNPASALVCANIFLKALLTATEALALQKAVASSKIPRNGPREAFLRARSWIDEKATLRVEPFPKQDSSLIRPFIQSNCLIRQYPDMEATQEGGIVDIIRI